MRTVTNIFFFFFGGGGGSVTNIWEMKRKAKIAELRKRAKYYAKLSVTSESVCDETKNLNETESKTFFSYQFFSIPKFYETNTDTFIDTIKKHGKVLKLNLKLFR